jgi:membrane-bound ClpP family serine protease
VRWRQNWRQWLSDHSIIGAVVNLRFTLLLALLESAGAVAVFVLSFVCVIFYFIWYVVTMSA